MRWFLRKQEPMPLPVGEYDLTKAVERAHMDWKNAQQMVSLSEGAYEVDEAIYYLQLTEKRYMFLFNQVRKQRLGKEA